ncbi:MAG: DNA gyrase subunit A [bacterium]
MNRPAASKDNKTDDMFINVTQRDIGEEMKSSYIDYSMSVIVGRALPDVRDGLKPVHRRILYTMDEMGLKHNKPYKKSARVVGDVMGKYHPHGDAAIYDTMVRMAQAFSMRHVLVDGQGNFGSIDGDPPAAMRYTEARLAGVADELLADIEKDTIKFIPNYDGSLTEPSVLPAKLPNLLLNGSSGIAVGMATNIPTHNLSEICDATIAIMENPDIGTKELIKLIKGPDFPTAGIICGRQGIKDYFETGRGSIKIQARTDIEEMKGNRQAIIINELPYQVNKAVLVETIADLVRNKKITDISDIRDESDRRGMRVVIEIKRDGNAQVVLNLLYKHTQMRTSFGVIMLAISNGRPRIFPLKEILNAHIVHRGIIITGRTRFDLNKALARAHILEGFLIALKHLDEIVQIIRKSSDADEARTRLMTGFKLSKIQAQAVLDMRLHQLTRLEAGQIEEEHKTVQKLIEELRAILADPKKVTKIIIKELGELKEKYGEARRTQITGEAEEVSLEDLIPEEEVAVTISHGGYVKRLPGDTYKAQGRGGKGITGSDVKEDDFIEHLFVTSSHSTILLFTTRGKVYSLKAFEIPEAGRTSRRKALVNLLPVTGEEKITSAIAIRSFDEARGRETYLFMCTRNGTVKKTAIADFANIRRSGIAAINLEEGDVLVDVGHTDSRCEVIIGTKDGMSIRFSEGDVRSMGRTAMGVRGIRLSGKDQVIGMECAADLKKTLLTVCENGYGKRTALTEYRGQHRGGGGVITIKATERNGQVVGIKLVAKEDDLMVMTEKGMAIRMRCGDIRIISRNTQGVRLVRLDEGDKIAGVAPMVKTSNEPEAEELKK